MTRYFSYLIISVILLSACTTAVPQTETSTTSTEQKSGFTTISGTVKANSASSAIIQTSSGAIPVETYAVDFTQFDGQTVTATGKYSGDTLFISELQATQ